MTDFARRVKDLPYLGIGVSTEYGAADGANALDIEALWHTHRQFAGFLEVGVEVAKGIDDHAVRWCNAGRPTTYHFLDVNLDEQADFDRTWLDAVGDTIRRLQPAWLCGDAGLWHHGPRERGHMLLLPPILSDESAREMAEGIVALRESTGCEVLPENPPGHCFVGDLHLLDFFARLCEYADTGFLLDAAHLAIFQQARGHAATTGLDGFPLDRIVEVHVAGATTIDVDGLTLVEDDHTVDVLPETWRILETVAPKATSLRAVVFECERNLLEATLPGFQRIASILAGTPFGALS